MSFTKEEFKKKLSGRISQVTNDDPYPQLKSQMISLGWIKSKAPDSGVATALAELLKAADQAEPRPSWEVLKEKIRQTGQDARQLKALAKNVVGLITKPALDEATDSHAFGKHFDASDDDQLERLLIEGKPQVTSILNEGENGRRYMAYTVQVAKLLPSLAKEHVRDICLKAWAAVANADPAFATVAGDKPKKRIISDALGGLRFTEDTDDCSIDFVWAIVVDGAAVTMTCSPTITSVEDFEKEIATLNSNRKMVKRTVEEPLEAFFGSKKFSIGPFDANSTSGMVNKMVEGVDFQVGFVTQY